MDLAKLFQKSSPQELALKRAISANPSGKGGFSFLFGQWVMLNDSYHTYIDQGFKAIPFVYGIVDQIAEKFSDAPRELMEIVDVKKSKGYDAMIRSARSQKDFFLARMLRIKAMRAVEGDHPYYKLMESPNPITPTEKTFNYARCGYLALTGNNYNFARTLGDAAGERATHPKQWWVIPSPACAPVVGKDVFDPILSYRVSYFEEDLPANLVQHVKLSNFTSATHDMQETLVGMPPLKPLLTTNTQIRDAEKANGMAFANLAPAGIVSGEGTDSMSEEDGLQIQEGFVKRHQGLESWKKIIVTPAKTHWTKIGFSPVDMQILEFMNKAEERIAKVYHYPLGLLNSKGEVANETINSRRMITDAVLPYIRRYDDADTQAVRKWYKNPKLKVVTDLQYFPELQEDMTRISTWLKEAYWLTVEEKREVMDYEEKWAGTMLIPSGMDTIENVTASKDLNGGDEFTL